MSFWYLADHLGRRFLRDAAGLFPGLSAVSAGLWRADVVGRPLFLVSNQDLPVERDTLPIHVLTREPTEAMRPVLEELARHSDLWPHYSGWLATASPALWEEVRLMARRTGREFPFDLRPVIERAGLGEVLRQAGIARVAKEVGIKTVIDEVGVKAVIDEVGPKRVLDELGVDALAAELTPKQRRELLRILQQGA